MCEKRRKITVIGGGNMGSVLAVKFSQKNDVTLYLNSPYEQKSDYSEKMLCLNEESGVYTEGKISFITDSLCDALKDAEYIFITFPSFLFKALAEKMIPYLKQGQHLVFIPGSGGAELFFAEAIKKGCTLTGLQRVHSVARIIKKGKEVRESGVRDLLKAASIPASFNGEAVKAIGELYSMKTEGLGNYLNITLINSNPILHTSRLYTVFKDFLKVKEYEKLPLFYEEWDIISSELLVKMDRELFDIIKVLGENGVTVNEITSLLQHYEAKDAFGITKKLNSINSLKGLETPHIVNKNNKFEPDLKSRYFTADFPFGLDILLSFADTLKTECSNMKTVSKWYHKITGQKQAFLLSDFGINSVEDIRKFYNL